MTSIKVPGVNTVRAKGRTYYYHRASGTRLKTDPSDFMAFVAEVAALNAKHADVAQPATRAGTVGGLITAYKASPEFHALAPDTQKGYQRVFDALKALDALALDELDQPYILALRDRVYAKRGRWLANMVVAVLSLMLSWGQPRGYVAQNAAKGVPKIRRNRSAGVANKAWTPAEAHVLLGRTSGGLKKAIALAYYGGLRKKDCVEVLQEARSSTGWIELLSSKPGRVISVFEAKRLTDILDEPDTAAGETLVVNRKGEAYTRDGLDTLFHRLKAKLVAEGLIRPGLTFHGLRKSLGKDAAELDFGENAIAGALGQANPASARPYTVEHAQRAAARRVIRALERRGKR